MNLLTQQTKELVRRKTEILVHGSEVEQEKEEDHHKNWTLRRMQTRGTCYLLASSNLAYRIFFFVFVFIYVLVHMFFYRNGNLKVLHMVGFEPSAINFNMRRKIGIMGDGKC